MDDSIRDKLLYCGNGTKRPVASILLIIINAAVWCIMEIAGDTLDGYYIAQYGGLYPDLLIYGGEWYRLFTAMFVHFGVHHLADNMIILGAAGSRLEKSVGPVKYLLIYLGAGLAGNMLSFYMMTQTHDYAVCAGASGAVFGIIGALVWAAVRSRGRIEGMSAKGLLFMTALCMYYGMTTEGIDNWAHLGGAAGGFFLCILLYRKPKEA